MSDFREFLAQHTNRPEPNITGSFQCHHCDEVASEAYYDPNNEKLYYWCPDGHESQLKDLKF